MLYEVITHGPSLLPNGNLMIYDNGDEHDPKASSPREYVIDDGTLEADDLADDLDA